MACEYCSSPIHRVLFDTDKLNAFVMSDGKLYVEYDGFSEQECVEVPINYCPMCKRNLRGDAK